MKRRRLQFAVLFTAVAGLLTYGALPAFATVPNPPTGVHASGADATADVGWVLPAPASPVITSYTITPSPACGGCTGLGPITAPASGTTGHSFVSGLTNGQAYTFTVHATNTDGNSAESAASNSVTPTATINTCNFNTFPAIPGNSSQLSVACTLTTAAGGAGNDYKIEDYPQVQWNGGEGRTVTTTAATAATSKVITASAGHFTAQDVNDTVSGTGVPSNAFIVSVTATTATLNKVVGSPGIASGAKLIVNNSDGRTFTDAVESGTTITSATAHFCKASLGNCGSGATAKNDVGRVLSGTQIQNGTTITAVNSAQSITISLPVVACPLSGPTAANCKQIGIGSLPTLSTNRQIKDATFVSPNKVCSATARFNQTDVNMPISSLSTPAKIPAGDYITAVGATGCPLGTTEATLKTNWVTGTNTNVIVGSRAASAPLTGDAVMSLSSELSVFPGEAAGLPSCDFNSAVGSNLTGKWNNPGSFDKTALGQPAALASTAGPMIAQLLVAAGAGHSFAAYVVQAGANTPGDIDTAPHVDIIFPALLTGVAVCPEPSAVGVATAFQFFGATLSQSISANGDVRHFENLPAGSPPVLGTAYEHILKGSSTNIATSQQNCTIQYPTPTAGYGCGGN
jgi:hypothetical protein